METVSPAAPAMDGGAPTQDVSASLEPQENLAISDTESKKPAEVPSFKGTKHKVKVDGKELEVAYEDLIKSYTLEQAGFKRMEEAAEYRKRVEQYDQLFDNLEKNPKLLRELAKTLNHDFDKLAEEALFEKYNYERMTPEQRRLHELEEKERRWTEQEERAKQEAARAEEQARVEKWSATVDEELGSFIETNKVDHVTFNHMLNLMVTALNQGVDLSPQQAYDKVKDHSLKVRNQWLSSMTPEEIMSLLPKSALEHIRKSDLAKAMSQVAPGRKLFPKPDTPKKTAQKKVGFDEYFAMKEKQFRLE